MVQAETRPPQKSAPLRRVTAIRRQRPLHEAAVDRLRDMIVEGALQPGDRLHEANLAETLNVSRTPIREALKLLATEGLVDLLPGRGARVSAPMSPDSIGALFEVIAGLERHACELAASRMTAREFGRLRRMHDRMAAHHKAGERHAYFKLNHAIHLGLVAAAGNDILQATHAALITKARRGRHTALASQARWEEAMAEHDLLMAALAARDGARAGAIMLQHDRRTGEVVRQLLEFASAA